MGGFTSVQNSPSWERVLDFCALTWFDRVKWTLTFYKSNFSSLKQESHYEEILLSWSRLFTSVTIIFPLLPPCGGKNKYNRRRLYGNPDYVTLPLDYVLESKGEEMMEPRPPATGQTVKATRESDKQETASSNRKWEIPASFLLRRVSSHRGTKKANTHTDTNLSADRSSFLRENSSLK